MLFRVIMIIALIVAGIVSLILVDFKQESYQTPSILPHEMSCDEIKAKHDLCWSKYSNHWDLIRTCQECYRPYLEKCLESR
jgi:hypothetical protein